VLEGAPTKSTGTSWGNPEILNVLDQLPRTQRRTARQMLRAVAYAPIRREAERQRKQFETWCAGRGYLQAAETLGRS